MKNEMNEDVQVDVVADYLSGRRVALAVSGGIAAIETPKLARQIRRFGGEVSIYTTRDALKFVGETALEWGCGREVTSELSGLAEHICREDIVLVAPATLNTINKIFAGIADNPATTLVASALGKGVPVYLAPTMHESLYKNPFLQHNLDAAQEYGIKIIPPRIGEGKAKMPRLDTIVAEVSRELSIDPIKGRKLLITGGPTPVKIDDVRRITNRFSGKTAIAIAKEAYHRGADVTLLLGKCGSKAPEYIHTLYHDDYPQYYQNVFSQLEMGCDAGIFSAAVADYAPETVFSGKIKSDGALKSIPLVQTRKVIRDVRERFPGLYMATFKFEQGVTQEELLVIARSRIADGYQLVVANRAEDMVNGHKAYIVGKEEVIEEAASKEDIGRKLISIICDGLGKRV